MDQRLPGQLYGRILRSPHPHARITRIDSRAAESLSGVHAVLTSANCPSVPWYEENLPLFDTTVRLIGDEVAAVAAETDDLAEDALRLIQVDYEVAAGFVPDIETAQRHDAPRVHPSGNRAGDPTVHERGDIAAGFAEAEVIVERVYVTQTALHQCLEPHGCTAWWSGDVLTLWDSTQAIWETRSELARALGVPEHNLRVIKDYMGGGFGSKQVPWKPTAIAALLSRAAGRPVQLLNDREGESLVAGNRNPTRQHVRLGARRDGTLTAISVRIDLAQGAYRIGGETAMVDGAYSTLYRCPNVRTDMTAHYINAGPAVAFRAPGYVEGTFGLESAMDELAHTLGLDPVVLRERNYTSRDQNEDKPYSSPEALRECWTAATSAFGWGSARSPTASGGGRRRRGVGFAVHNWIGGAGHPPGYAWIKLNPDASADVVTGTQDIGTGTRTGLGQVAADALGFPFERIRVHLGDTGVGPYAPVSSGSATQATIGPAIQVAADQVRAELLKEAANILEAPLEDLRLEDGSIAIAGTTRRVAVTDITATIAPRMIHGYGARGPNPADHAVRTFGAQCAEVEVDLETGEVQLLRLVASHDCGRIINPKMVESQIIGAVTQGIGYALMEERILDTRLGAVLNPNLEFYELPTVCDLPVAGITHAAHDVPDYTANPTGAKGVGEPPLIPTAPAIANAIFDAIGVRITELPMTRQRVLEAIRHAQL